MNIDFRGGGELANVLAHAAERRGFGVNAVGAGAALVVVAVGVSDHRDTLMVEHRLRQAMADYDVSVPIIVTSQVPPGWTRPWAAKRKNIFYQPHTLIAGHEAEMAYAPEAIVVGRPDSDEPLPWAYSAYLDAFGAPVYQMTYESAELSKLAMNYLLATQIEASNELARIAQRVGAHWDDIEASLRRDGRIGERAYISPGVVGGHLPRDVSTINRLRMLQ